MLKMRPIPYAEFRDYLQKFGFVEKRVPKGRVLEHREDTKCRLFFRYYRDDEPVHPRDLLSTRTSLDWLGIITPDDYDVQFLYSNWREMPKRPTITFGELHALLQRLGFAAKRTRKARVFQHPRRGMFVYRLYRTDEMVEGHDITYTRNFLDLRGILEADEFDATLLRANTPA